MITSKASLLDWFPHRVRARAAFRSHHFFQDVFFLPIFEMVHCVSNLPASSGQEKQIFIHYRISHVLTWK